MTEAFDRTLHRVAEPRWFEDLAVGERFLIPSRTMTEAHFSAFQTISADNHPIHYDVEYCRERGHKGPLAHGFQILAFTAAGASAFAHAIGDALIAFVEQSSKFLKPVYAGDTLYPMLEIAASSGHLPDPFSLRAGRKNDWAPGITHPMTNNARQSKP